MIQRNNRTHFVHNLNNYSFFIHFTRSSTRGRLTQGELLLGTRTIVNKIRNNRILFDTTHANEIRCMIIDKEEEDKRELEKEVGDDNG